VLRLVAKFDDWQSVPLGRSLGFVLRTTKCNDRAALGALYFAAYPPGAACDTIEEAIAKIDASFVGDDGELGPDASSPRY
jgi:hypothetical protein